MKKIIGLFLLTFSLFSVQLSAQCECNDGIDNDGDGLVDWQYDLGCTGVSDCTEGGATSRSIQNGWTVMEPAVDTKIYYVSSSSGSDANTGLSPAQALQTIAAAHSLCRDNFSDWILLKRGDVFLESLDLRYGRSRTEPFLVASYGSSTTRPLLKTGTNFGVIQQNRWQYVAIIGIAFYAHTRNPATAEYISSTLSQPGFYFFASDVNYPGISLLIEDCTFDFYANNIVQGTITSSDVVLRRNVISNNYSETAHSQGLFMNNVDDVLLEENIFDHNGWLIQAIPPFSNAKAGGQATFFNHNTYVGRMSNMTIRKNIFARSSSINNKFTADSGPGSTHDVLIDNNLYIDGEIGISIGGNDSVNPYRYKNTTISNNVMLNIGRSQPTTRDIAWYLDIDDWDIGTVQNNLFLNQPKSSVTNTFGIRMLGYTRDVTINNNVFHGLKGSLNILSTNHNDSKENILVSNNKFSNQNSNQRLVFSMNPSVSSYTFQDNWYDSSLPSASWFQINGTNYDLSGWAAFSGETGGQAAPFPYCDDTRNIETYQTHIGEPATIDDFITSAKGQSKYNWQTNYEAVTINDWIRGGFVCSAPLPLFLINFDGTALQKKNKLYGSYEKSQQVDQIIVERSQEGQRFTNIGHIIPNNSDAQIDFEFMDKTPFFKSFYRLKIIDFNGSVDYSPIISITNSLLKKKGMLYPNPAFDFIHLPPVPFSENYEIWNQLGQLQKAIFLRSGQVKIDVSDLNKGIYFLRSESTAQLYRFVKN